MDDIELVAGIPLSLLVMGCVAALRQAGLPSKYAPMVSVALGITFALIAYVTDTVEFSTWFAALVAGIVSGLTASGIYSSVKKFAEAASE